MLTDRCMDGQKNRRKTGPLYHAMPEAGTTKMKQALKLALKAPITTAADDIFFQCLSEKIRLGVTSESSASLKNQALFSSKGESKKFKMPPAAIFVWRFKGQGRH